MPRTSTDLAPIAEQARSSPQRYAEFLRVPALSAGAYVLGVGSTDRQRPHAEDEIYFVVSGRGRFRREEDDRPVAAGEVLFVPAHAPHRFHSIEEELVLLVVFGPSESVPAERAGRPA